MNKQKIIVISICAILAALVSLITFRWQAWYGGRNPVDIERAKAAIERGRGYEVLEENRVYLTDDTHVSELLYFLEGHYGMRMEAFEEDRVTLKSSNGDMAFHLTEIVSFGRRYMI